MTIQADYGILLSETADIALLVHNIIPLTNYWFNIAAVADFEVLSNPKYPTHDDFSRL